MRATQVTQILLPNWSAVRLAGPFVRCRYELSGPCHVDVVVHMPGNGEAAGGYVRFAPEADVAGSAANF